MKTFLAIILAVITVATASAEPVTITFKSGGTMKGPLVGKTANEIKIETAYGIITLQSTAVTPESWTTAQRATLSKPSGKYVVPTPSPKPRKYVQEDHAHAGPTDGAISVADVNRAYKENPIAADLRFDGKPIAVRGTISDIGTDILGDPFVTIGQKVIKIYSKGSKNQIAHLKIGQVTTLSGNCRGMSLGLLLIRE